ncbi:MAG: MaoC/PaaZ C-terminal domain-containing protein [Pseudomonadota bacterium]
MAIDYAALMERPFPLVRQAYSRRDTMLYALSIGAGADPLDESDLAFVYEENLQALPMMACVLASPGFWLREPDTGIDWKMVLHAEQNLEIHKPLPVEAEIFAQNRIEEIIDKGLGRGAILYQRRDITDEAGTLYATVRQSTFVRGEGGFGGAEGPLKPVHTIPDRAPDLSVDVTTRPAAALLYRLNGDYNPLHADPAVAHSAGFERPILHGLCTYAIAGKALIRALLDNQPERIRGLDARFSAPVLPGHTIRVEIWRGEAGSAAFRCVIVETEQVALNNGQVRFD